jgi:4-hydroxybenzoate polyprenyltransferase
MIIRLANVIYWLATLAAAALLALALAGFFVGQQQRALDPPAILSVLAVLVWLAGRAVLYVFAAR